LLPSHKPLVLLPPDLPGDGPIPDGYLRYPARLVKVVSDKPGRGSAGPPVKSMTAVWGPTPPGLGRNSFVAAVNRELGLTMAPSTQDGLTFANKLSAMLGARDIPELLSVPSWEVDKIPRFSQAVKALFADLTEYLQGDRVNTYPLLATLPTPAWQFSVWGGRLAAVPFPSDLPFPWALFYRKDLCDQAGIEAPRTIDEFYRFGKKLTNPGKGVWAFGEVFQMLQMFFKCPGSMGGWRKTRGGGLEFKYETAAFRDALEFTTRLNREGMIHPEVIATNGNDASQLFNSGKLIAHQNGMGAFRPTVGEQRKITRGFDMQPMPVFSAEGGEPLVWAAERPIFYPFLRRDLGKARTEELLRVLDWCAAPFGSQEFELNRYGVEGSHFTRAPDGSPVQTDLGRKELAEQFQLLGGRVPVQLESADAPGVVNDTLRYARHALRYREPDLFQGIKLELPANYAKLLVGTEEKITDIVRGRRPVSDLAQIVSEWRRAGGDEGREFMEKVLSDNGR
jgi:putative aldouronate transport system substrate-binding protein